MFLAWISLYEAEVQDREQRQSARILAQALKA